MKFRTRKAAGAGLVLIALALLGCGSGPTPEERIAAWVQQAEAAAEARDVDRLMELVSKRYEETQGRSLTEIRGRVGFYFRQARNVFVLTRIESIEYAASGPSRVTVFAAMAQQPLKNATDLRELTADLLRFELTLEQLSDGSFKVLRAEVQPATLIDFF